MRVLAVGVPFAVAALAAIGISAVLPPARTTPSAIIRTLVIIGASMLTMRTFDRMVRRILPLATLLQLSLVFPDQAPSRIRTAMQSGSSRNVRRLVEQTRSHGLDRDPAVAAEQVLLLINAVGQHDRRTRGHCERMRAFADLIGQELGLSPEERMKLQWAALLHDLGKLTVPAEILNKAGKPTAEEWAILEQHPVEGARIAEPLADFLGEWAAGIVGHHERWDGTGYPQRLAGRDIPRAAAIVAVADSFEVMTARRSYKTSTMSIAEARAELTRCAGSHFSPEVVRAFLGISLGRIRLALGPLAALAHVPFLSSISSVPMRLDGVFGASSLTGTLSAGASTVGVAASGAAMSTGLAVMGAVEVRPLPPTVPIAVVTAADVRLTPAAAAGVPTVNVSRNSAGRPVAKLIEAAIPTATGDKDPTVIAALAPSLGVVPATPVTGPTATTTTTRPGTTTTTTTTPKRPNQGLDSDNGPSVTIPTGEQPEGPLELLPPPTISPTTTKPTTTKPTTKAPVGTKPPVTARADRDR